LLRIYVLKVHSFTIFRHNKNNDLSENLMFMVTRERNELFYEKHY